MNNPFNLNPDEIAIKAKSIRRNILKMNHISGQGHTGGDLSEVDILSLLYFNALRYDITDLEHPDRDRFILSKGHGVGGYYCTLIETGIIKDVPLEDYLKYDSPLPGHPVRQKTPAIEVNTGALGHGLSIAVGIALSAKLQKKDYRAYVLTGDGELQEGSNWEAAMSASKFQLDNLVVFVDRNRLQLGDRTETIMPLENLSLKWRSFGFEVLSCNGNDPAELLSTIGTMDFENGKPKVIIANTKKGFGVSFIQDNKEWHHKVPNELELTMAMEELK